MLNEIFSNSNVDLVYDSIEFIVSKIENLNYNVTKTLCE